MLFRVLSGGRRLKAMEVMEMPAIQLAANPTGARYIHAIIHKYTDTTSKPNRSEVHAIIHKYKYK